MLGLGSGFAAEDPDGRLVASGMVLPCADRFAWIAMILVTKKWRRRGLATAIMARAIETCRERGWIAGLDATEAGRPVYLPLGFRDVYRLTRWAAPRVTAGDPRGPGVVRVAKADLAGLADYDAARNGGRRERLLAHFAGRAPDLAFKLVSNGDLRGFLLARGRPARDPARTARRRGRGRRPGPARGRARRRPGAGVPRRGGPPRLARRLAAAARLRPAAGLRPHAARAERAPRRPGPHGPHRRPRVRLTGGGPAPGPAARPGPASRSPASVRMPGRRARPRPARGRRARLAPARDGAPARAPRARVSPATSRT